MSERIIDPEVIEVLLKGSGVENFKEVAREFVNLKTAATGAAGSESEGTGFAGMSRQAFMAERAINALISGQGLARAGPILEGVLGFIGGPAGMGFAIGGVALAAEKYIPELLKHFDLMGTKTEEQSKKFIDSLNKMADHYAKIVKDMEKIPAPGMGLEHAAEKAELEKLFNEKTLPGGGGLEMQLLPLALAGRVSRMIPGETEALAAAKKKADDLAAKRKLEQELIKANTPGVLPTVSEKMVQHAAQELNDLEGKAAGLTVSRLLAEAKDPTTKEGKEALRQIGNLLPNLKPRIDAILQKSTAAGEDFLNRVPRNRFSSRGSKAGEDGENEKEIHALELADWQEELAKGPKSRSRREELERRIAQAMGIESDESPYHGRTARRMHEGAQNRQMSPMWKPSTPSGPMRQIPSHSGPFDIHDTGPEKQPASFKSGAGKEAAGINAALTQAKQNIDSSLAAIAQHGEISGKLHDQLSLQQAQYKELHRQLSDLRRRVDASGALQRGQQNAGGN